MSNRDRVAILGRSVTVAVGVLRGTDGCVEWNRWCAGGTGRCAEWNGCCADGTDKCACAIDVGRCAVESITDSRPVQTCACKGRVRKSEGQVMKLRVFVKEETNGVGRGQFLGGEGFGWID